MEIVEKRIQDFINAQLFPVKSLRQLVSDRDWFRASILLALAVGLLL